jgi:hypothetical protein
LGRKNFDRKNFGFSNFRAKNFWPGQLSTGIFFDFSNFEPKKIPENADPARSRYGRSTTWMRVSCVTNTIFSNFRAGFFLIFQLSIQKFSGFSNFEPEIFPTGNFRAEKNRVAKISDRPCRARSVVRDLVAVGALRRWSVDCMGIFPVLL